MFYWYDFCESFKIITMLLTRHGSVRRYYVYRTTVAIAAYYSSVLGERLWVDEGGLVLRFDDLDLDLDLPPPLLPLPLPLPPPPARDCLEWEGSLSPPRGDDDDVDDEGGARPCLGLRLLLLALLFTSLDDGREAEPLSRLEGVRREDLDDDLDNDDDDGSFLPLFLLAVEDGGRGCWDRDFDEPLPLSSASPREEDRRRRCCDLGFEDEEEDVGASPLSRDEGRDDLEEGWDLDGSEDTFRGEGRDDDDGDDFDLEPWRSR